MEQFDGRCTNRGGAVAATFRSDVCCEASRLQDGLSGFCNAQLAVEMRVCKMKGNMVWRKLKEKIM